jgi:hypothetical protein
MTDPKQHDPVYPPNLTDRVVALRALTVARLQLSQVEDVGLRDQLAAALDAGDVRIEPVTDEGEVSLLVVVAGRPLCSTPLEPLIRDLIDGDSPGIGDLS